MDVPSLPAPRSTWGIDSTCAFSQIQVTQIPQGWSGGDWESLRTYVLGSLVFLRNHKIFVSEMITLKTIYKVEKSILSFSV